MNSVINSAQSVYEVIREKEAGVHKGFAYVSTDYDDDNAGDDNSDYDNDGEVENDDDYDVYDNANDNDNYDDGDDDNDNDKLLCR